MKGQSFLNTLSLTPLQITKLLDFSSALKAAKLAGKERQYLKGKNIVLVFEKDSTRTRCAFEAVAFDQGANITYIGPNTSHISSKESIKDTARVLGSFYDAIAYRGYGQDIVEQLAKYSGIPVFNALTNELHPTQSLADVLTMREQCPKPLNRQALCFIGHGNNNVANSLLIICAKLGVDFRIACPKIYNPDESLLNTCKAIAAGTGGKITVTDSPAAGVLDCDFIYTDVWLSMGEPADIIKERIASLLPYRVTAQLMAAAGNPQVKFLHCLPAIHNKETDFGKQIYAKYGLDCMEVTDEVFESCASVVFEQAANRLHTIKAVMAASLKGA